MFLRPRGIWQLLFVGRCNKLPQAFEELWALPTASSDSNIVRPKLNVFVL